MLNYKCHAVRSGYNGVRCLVHARCCAAPRLLIATAQYLDVSGCDLFSGLYASRSTDGGETWSDFSPEAALAPIREGNTVTVGCDATPMYHKGCGRVILLGQTATYRNGDKKPMDGKRYTFYSFYDRAAGAFGKMQRLQMPKGFEECGNGSGQSLECENGDLLIPVYYLPSGEGKAYSCAVLRCAVDAERESLRLLEIGSPLCVDVERGLYEPSITYHAGKYYLTMRNDQCGFVAVSEDGLHYKSLSLWRWQDGSLLDTYNTQQHWMHVGEELYLVYTRRDADNAHVFRHRAPLYAARVENMRLVRGSEIALTPQRGARLGNFGVCSLEDGSALVMAAEWMQPQGCERYGSDNSIFLSVVTPDKE